MKLVFHLNGRRITKWCLTLLGLGWMLLATWMTFIQPSPMAQVVYESEKSGLAQCRKQSSSDARYQCTSKILLARENLKFNKIMLILLPPLGLMICYLGLASIIKLHRNRMKGQAAQNFSQQRMAEWRSHLNEMRATLEAQKKTAENAALMSAYSSESQSRRAKKR